MNDIQRPPFGTKCARCGANWAAHTYSVPLRLLIGACEGFVMPEPPNIPKPHGPFDHTPRCNTGGCRD